MTSGWVGARLAMLGVAVTVGVSAIGQAEARYRPHAGASQVTVHAIQVGMSNYRYGGHFRSAGHYARFGGGGLQCVPFARENTGIELSGNAANWWANAEGVYERGARPEVGSVLNFRANGRMRMGHVAVVSNVLNSRSVEIDHRSSSFC